MMGPFERRIERAEHLMAVWPFSAEALRFLCAVTRFQREVHDHLAKAPRKGVEDLLPFVAPLLDLLARQGPAQAAVAARPRRLPRAAWVAVLLGEAEPEDALGAFVRRALHSPLRMVAAPGPQGSGAGDMSVASSEQPQGEGAPMTRCPRCGSLPLTALIREDPQAAARVRWLSCSLCTAEWRFPRVLCPGCLEERPERLPRLTASAIPWVRIEACGSCGRYMKGIDMTLEPAADAVADELGSIPLDLLAAEEGHVKLAHNLLGM